MNIKVKDLLNKHASKWIVLSIDILLVLIAFLAAYFIRFDASFNFNHTDFYQIPFIAVLSFICFLKVGSYKGIIRHTGIKDVYNVSVATILISFLFGILVTLNRVFDILSFLKAPISIIFIHFFVSIFLLIISRFLYKSLYNILNTDSSNHTNILIYGAGDSGIFTMVALQRDTKRNYNILGFIDDDKKKVGKKINRIKIYGIGEIDSELITRFHINEIIISIQNITSQKLLTITDNLIQFPVKVKITPPVRTWIDGDLKSNQIKSVVIEDLLNRAPINLSNPIIGREVNNKVILITGAAGSIGSEITRQLSRYTYAQLILIDHSESALYDLQQELKQLGKDNIISIVSNVTDFERMSQIFSIYKPSHVYHAAAYKHVPLMEENPYEAIKTNITGTKTIADLSLKNGVDRFVMISTDKAVNPTNIMGATKRVAELYISCLSKKSKHLKFTTTRFGNVLGSNGSVIPLFKRQIAKGMPLTVTHKEITRYFMTIPEACSLVLEAGTMGEGGEIYIFDMGKAVKIFNIAKKMIHLSGLRYPEDIDIKITGLRPGEKLYEELLANGENTLPTYNEKILIAKTKSLVCSSIKEKINALSKNNSVTNCTENILLMKSIVPEFLSQNYEFELLDK